MKKLFTKRILPVVMCLFMVLPLFVFNVAANPSALGEPADRSIIGTETKNWAPNGQGYHSSVWNNDRHSKYLNNGTYNHSYQWWEPTAPERANGAGVDPTKQYFGFTFSDGYYLLDYLDIYCHKFNKGFNNIKYTVEALILGEWVTVGVAYQDDAVATDISSDIVKLTIELSHPNGDAFYYCTECKGISDKTATECSKCGAAKDSLELKKDVNTNNIRVWTNEYGYYAKRPAGDCDHAECNAAGYHIVEVCSKAPTKHDWWYTPKIQEVEIYGVTGYKPEFEVPMNAYLVNNAALSGMLGADDSADMQYPGLAGDDKLNTYWVAMRKGAKNIWAEFDKEYPLSKVGINVGGIEEYYVDVTITYNIKLLVSGTLEDGEWITVVENATATASKELQDFISVEFDEPVNARAMKVEITKAVNSAGKSATAVMTELQAEIANGGRCIFLADYMTAAKKMSTATGNLACYGKAYASSNFAYASVSRVENIIDGNVGYASEAWIAANYLKGTYVGVTLKEAHDVTKVALYFEDALGGKNGANVFEFDVQAKVNGEFVTIAQGTSYDATKNSYNVSIVIPNAVNTDDIRIVFKTDAQTFPYLKELEVFEGDFVYSSYDGYSLDASRTSGGPNATVDFASRTVASRGRYLDMLSPVEYFNIALEHDVQIDWLG